MAALSHSGFILSLAGVTFVRAMRSGVVVAFFVVTTNAWAQQSQQVDPAVARAQQLLKQVAAEKQRLEGELARMREEMATKDAEHQREIEALKSDNESTRTSLSETQATLEEAQQSNLSLGKQLGGTQNQLGRTQTELQAVTQKQQDTEATLQQTIAECDAMKANLEAQLAEQTRLREETEAKNLKLYEYNVDLMNIYADKGVMDSLLQREPFTGIKQVEIENILEEYSYKLDQQKVEPSAAASQ
jgi:chromosome segregation ATPase